jgi:hypothetical protein
MKKIIVPLIILIAFLPSACNLPAPAAATGISLEQQAATVVGMTLTASAQNVPLASPTSESLLPLPSATAEAAPTIQPNATPTGGPTTLTVDSNTNCREGPSTDYKVVIVLVPGSTYQIIARAQDNKYWVVTEIGKSNLCWVPAEMSNAFGNVTLLPAVTPAAPTSSAGALQPPVGLQWQYDCVFNGIPGNIQVVLNWTDRSNNETGFRVYRDGSVIGTVGAGVTTYVETFTGSVTAPYSYRISSFNETGEAMGSPISFSCNG